MKITLIGRSWEKGPVVAGAPAHLARTAIDDGPVVPRFATFGSDGASIYPWVADHADAWKKLKNGKRLRVQIGPHLFDFDLKQGGQELPAVRC